MFFLIKYKDFENAYQRLGYKINSDSLENIHIY